MAPGTGAFLAALEYATGATGRVVGKPEPQLFYTALDRIGPGRALVIGDRLESDLAGAAAAGLDAAIVLSGVSLAPGGGGRPQTRRPWPSPRTCTPCCSAHDRGQRHRQPVGRGWAALAARCPPCRRGSSRSASSTGSP